MNLFLIGSGFTKSVFPQAPLNNDLISVLLRENPGGASRILTEKYNTGDIEVALTKLELDISVTSDESERGKLTELRANIILELVKHFHAYRASEELIGGLPWLRDFFGTVVNIGDTVISLNYDALFEGLLDCMGKWTPNGGYGNHFVYPFEDEESCAQSPVTVLKIHGSITFKSAPYFDKPQCKSVNFIFNEHYFPKTAKDKHFGYGLDNGEIYLIAPSYVKVPSVKITYSMIDGMQASSDATNLMVIGCGLRPEDTFLTLLLTNFLKHPDWKERRIIIVDPKANEIAGKIRHYWGVDVDRCIVPIQGILEKKIGELRQYTRASLTA